MLMVKRTPRTSPRLTGLPLPPLPLLRALRIPLVLTPPVIPPGHRDPAFHTPRTEAQTAIITSHGAMTRLDQRATILTAPRPMPAIRAPHPQPMSLKGLRTGALKQHTQIAQEMRMPRIHMTLDQPIRLLERKQIEHQIPQGRGIANPFVQNPCIAGRQHAVRLVREVGDQIDDAVAQTLHAQPVRERVHVQKGVVRWFPIFERRGDSTGVQPGDDEGEMIWAHVVEGDGFGFALDEGAGERGAEVGRLRDEQGGVDAERGEFWTDQKRCCGSEVLRVGAVGC